MRTLSDSPPLSPLMEEWRTAHRAAVRHIKSASWDDCGCAPHRLCADGQSLEDAVEDIERRLGLVPFAPGVRLG